MTRVLFLGGLGRSGTTLIERVLGQLPGVVALGEVVHLWRRDLREGEHCGCGTPFLRCRFWDAVGRRAFGGWQHVDVDRVLRLRERVDRTRHIPRLATAFDPGQRTALELSEYVGHYQRIYAAAGQVAGARVVIDSSKHSALAWCLSQREVDLRVVQVVRDARGVAYSWTQPVVHPERPGTQTTRYPPAGSALRWTARNAALGLLARRGVPVLRIRYEQFLADPHRSVRELASFAGLDPARLDLGFLGAHQVQLKPGHSAAGNPMRFAAGSVPLRRDDEWRERLPTRHRRLVGALCAPLLRAYGYPLRSRPWQAAR